jgi:hypothetical protein
MRTLYQAEGFCDQFVRGEFIFLHVGYAVGIMPRKVSATYHAPMITTNAAADEVDALIAT